MSSSVSGSRSPGLAHTCSRELAQLAGLDVRTIQRLKRHAIATPHERNRGLLTLITAHLAARQLQAWGLDPPHGPLEQIATYLDHRGSRDSTDTCVICGRDLIGQQQLYCSPRCSKRAYRARREATPETPPYASGNTSQPPMPAAETGAMSMAGGISPRRPFLTLKATYSAVTIS